MIRFHVKNIRFHFRDDLTNIYEKIRLVVKLVTVKSNDLTKFDPIQRI